MIMVNGYVGRTNNHARKLMVPRGPKPEPARSKSLMQLTDEYLETALGSDEARATLFLLARRVRGN